MGLTQGSSVASHSSSNLKRAAKRKGCRPQPGQTLHSREAGIRSPNPPCRPKGAGRRGHGVIDRRRAKPPGIQFPQSHADKADCEHGRGAINWSSQLEPEPKDGHACNQGGRINNLMFRRRWQEEPSDVRGQGEEKSKHPKGNQLVQDNVTRPGRQAGCSDSDTGVTLSRKRETVNKTRHPN